MSTVVIEYDVLKNAASSASATAKKMSEYSESLSSVVESPLSSLPGGNSEFVSSAIESARAKSRELLDRADKYESLSKSITTFVEDTGNADGSVRTKFEASTNELQKNMSLWDRICCGVYDLFSKAIGDTPLGAFLQNLANGLETLLSIRDWVGRKIYDFFAYGAGRYIIEGALSVLAAVGAVALLVGGLIAGTLSGVFLVAAVIAAAGLVGRAVIKGVSIYQSAKANYGEENPGLAKYYLKASTLKDFAKQNHWGATAVGVCGVISTAVDVSSLVSNAAGLFEAGKVGRLATFKEELPKLFGFSKAGGSWKFSLSTLLNGFDTSEWSKFSNLRRNVEKLSFVEKGLTVTKSIIDLRKGFNFDSLFEGFSVFSELGEHIKRIVDIPKGVLS